MALVCNIDQRGRKHRYRIGFAFLVLAVALYALGYRSWDGTPLRVVVGLLTLAGLFSIFEANRGWCAARALGFKTKI